MGHTTAMFFRGLIGTILLAVSIGLSNLPAVAQSPLRSGPLRDLNSIVEAKVLRVAVTRFDLPSFHVRGPDGTLLGPEMKCRSKSDARSASESSSSTMRNRSIP